MLTVRCDRDVVGVGRRGAAGGAPERGSGATAGALRRRRRPARHLRPHAVGGAGRPGRGSAARRPARRRHGPAAVGADRAGRRRGARPGRRRHPRGRHPAPAERLDGGPHVHGRRAVVAGGGFHVVAGVHPLSAVGHQRAARRASDPAAALRAQGGRGDGVDRSRRRAGGGRGRARRPAHQPGSALRPAPVHPARGRGARAVRRRGEPRGPGRSPYRHAAPRRARGHGSGRRDPGHRRPPLHGVAGHAVPGHHDVRRTGRPAGAPPARPAGRVRCGDPAPRADGLGRRAGRWSVASRRPALGPLRRPPLRLCTRHLRAVRRRPDHPRRYDVRPGRPHRLRQVDPGLPAVPRGRARAGVAAPRRRRRASPRAPSAPGGRGRGHPAHRDPGRHARREHHALRRPPPCHGGRRGRRARSDRLGRRAAPA
jgi:hypothetical protein